MGERVAGGNNDGRPSRGTQHQAPSDGPRLPAPLDGIGLWSDGGAEQHPALLDRDAYAAETSRARVLLGSGLSGRGEDVGLALRVLELFAEKGEGLSDRVALSAVPCGSPDRLRGQTTGGMGDASTGYPPGGNFYYDTDNPERRYLWRWSCFQAPDLLLEVRTGEGATWEANAAAQRLATPLNASAIPEEESLLAALGTGVPDDLGRSRG